MSFKYGNLTGIAFGIGQALISILFSLIFYIGALLVQSGTITVLQLYTSVYAIMFSGIQTGSNIHFVGKLAAAGVAACNYF